MKLYREFLSQELRDRALKLAIEEFERDSLGVIRSSSGLAWHSSNVNDSDVSKRISLYFDYPFLESWFMIYGPGGGTKSHRHNGAKESVAITLYGSGKLEVLREVIEVNEGDMIKLSFNEKHRALPSITSRVVFVANLGEI